MKRTKLTWFDRLMIGVTYAEAGVEDPVRQREGRSGHRRSIRSDNGDELYGPGRNCTIPVST